MYIMMEHIMKENGKMIKVREKAKKHIMMEVIMKVNLKME